MKILRFFYVRSFTLAYLLFPMTGFAELTSEIKLPDKYASVYKISDSYLKQSDLKNISIAVVAEGYAGAQEIDREAGKRYLPETYTSIDTHEGREGFYPNRKDDSGRRAAQVLWATLGGDETAVPQITFYNANTLTDFAKTITALTDNPPDIVLGLVNYPDFGRFDGTGQINRMVEQVIDSGAIWIQSAGHDYGRTRWVKASVDSSGRVKFGESSYLKLYVDADQLDVSFFLSWNSFSPGYRFRGTDKDFDLFIYKPGQSSSRPDRNSLLASSTLKQVKESFDESDPKNENLTNLSHEVIDDEKLFVGEKYLYKNSKPYFIEVRKKSGDIDALRDEVRMTLKLKQVPYFDPKEKKWIDPIRLAGENTSSIGVPADNKKAITVGSTYVLSNRGRTRDGRQKPEITLDKDVAFFTDSVGAEGTHIAAAQIAAMAAMIKVKFPNLTQTQLKTILTKQQKTVSSSHRNKRQASTLLESDSEVFSMPTLEEIETALNEE